jgi:hypothetical protein
MSASSGNRDEMGRIWGLRDEEIDRLLAGQVPAGQELDDLAAFSRTVRESLPRTPSPAVENAHLAVIAEAARLASDPALVPGGQTERPDRERVGRPRRRTMSSVIFGTLAAKIATVTVAAAAATGGLAATGSLPAPAQDAVASAVSHVGVHFPTSQDGEDGTDANEDGTDANEHGKTVSDTARTTDKTGREKGEEVSGVASTKSTEHRRDAEHRPSDVPANDGLGDPAGNGSPTVPSGNPTGYGQDSQPSGNPTGYGQDSHPSGNPTGYGEPSHPGGP